MAIYNLELAEVGNNKNERRGEMNQNFTPCPLCDGQKKQGCLVCFNCHQMYLEEAASIALSGEVAPSKEEWGERKIQERLPVLEKALAEARKALQISQRLQAQKIEEVFREKTKNQRLHLDIVAVIKRKILETDGNKIWEEVGGQRTFRNLKIAEARLKEANRLLEDLSKKAEGFKDDPADPPQSTDETQVIRFQEDLEAEGELPYPKETTNKSSRNGRKKKHSNSKPDDDDND